MGRDAKGSGGDAIYAPVGAVQPDERGEGAAVDREEALGIGFDQCAQAVATGRHLALEGGERAPEGKVRVPAARPVERRGRAVHPQDRTSVGKGKSGAVRVELGGRGIIKKKK